MRVFILIFNWAVGPMGASHPWTQACVQACEQARMCVCEVNACEAGIHLVCRHTSMARMHAARACVHACDARMGVCAHESGRSPDPCACAHMGALHPCTHACDVCAYELRSYAGTQPHECLHSFCCRAAIGPLWGPFRAFEK